MFSRRELLKGAAVTGAAGVVRGAIPTFAAVSTTASPVTFDLPAGGCDCHVHVFGDPRRYPMSPSRGYTPEPATAADLRAMHKAIRVERVVVVQPSTYGADNTCTLDAIKELGSRARGIAVIEDKTPDSALDQLHRGGIRGLRLNMGGSVLSDRAAAHQRIQAAAARCKGRPWHLQTNIPLARLESVRDAIMASPVPVVLDHFCGARPSEGVEQPGFETLVNLLRSGKAYVKLSAVYRSSTQAPDYADMAPIAKALIAANPQRILWGTDWPHPNSARRPGGKNTDVTPLYSIDNGRVLNQLAIWAPDAGLRKTILVDNPARLYGF